jgi:hypothetical protein
MVYKNTIDVLREGVIKGKITRLATTVRESSKNNKKK